MKLKKRALPATLLCAAALFIPATAQANPACDYSSLEDMAKAPSPSDGTVTAVGDDGSDQEYSVTDTREGGKYGEVSTHLQNDKWAVPAGLQNHSRTQIDSTAVQAELSVARSYVGVELTQSLSWSESSYRQTGSYYDYCAYLSLILKGYDYQQASSTGEHGTKAGEGIDFGQFSKSEELKKAPGLASWFYSHGDVWLSTNSESYQAGDVLFFSEQSSTEVSFANVYHAALYLGNGKILDCEKSPSGKYTIVEKEFSGELKAHLSIVARASTQYQHKSSSNESGKKADEQKSHQSACGDQSKPTCGDDEADDNDHDGDDATCKDGDGTPQPHSDSDEDDSDDGWDECE
ncbi:hypothetical protein [uncultured Propionibacterium sp.]|uniref:hypothetical protein n=1 Tax=uncultured Propionibacterium sp. TaxID=218066 RepID=UPI0029311C07|nr:hypothetical protein [uncultured Propionibacterium sp.]